MGIRRSVSLALANGHPLARRYPLGMLWDECNFITERKNAELVSQMSLMQTMASSLFSKEGQKAFKKAIRTVSVQVKPVSGEG